MYDQLSRHEIPWTDQSVKDALTEMAKIVGDADNIAADPGRTPERLPDVGEQRLRRGPEGGHGHRGRLRPGVVESPLEPETGYNVFPFPSINDSPPRSSAAVTSRSCSTTRPRRRRSSSTWRPRRRPRSGPAGAGSRRRTRISTERLPGSDHGDDRDRDCRGGEFRFDLSDLQPSEFGSTRARASGSSSRTSWRIRTTSTGSPSRWRRRQRPRTESRHQSPLVSGASITAEPGIAGSAGRARSRLAKLRDRRGLPCADDLPRALDRLSDDQHVQAQLLSRSGDEFVWFDNYEQIFTSDVLFTAVKNNAIWVLVVPALVTAIGSSLPS